MDYIQIQPVLSRQGSNPTPQQREIYNFHERLHSAQADDIYSLEWFQRTQHFQEKFAQSAAHSKTLDSWEMVEALDLAEFFLAHPIAGYSLWNMLQACFELDRVICANSAQELDRVERWQLYKPFIYFKDKEKKIRGKWKKSLKLLKKEIECGFLEGDSLVQKLYGILSGVERLESAFRALEDDFPVNLKGLQFVDDMLKKIATVVEDRRRMIAEILRLDDSNPGLASDSEGSFHYLSGKSSSVRSREFC
jgi:exonuclease V gamma subunit